eukprot:TRINITY_DN904_c0_g2_i1.p1 TRINITY_DN904_c0_g2~~TRINITY_DN904_c0_g2_i1.p1  ORF type:complete len:191 (-),score=35.76 TRINITY_DN904_c0_g2_i1:95-667(-)
MSLSSHADGCCQCQASRAAPGAQTLDELSFEKGLWCAAKDGNLARMKQLLGGGGYYSDPSMRDASGYTPLHYAARGGRLEACRVLLDRGADANAVTLAGHSTPLQRAAFVGHLEVVVLLTSRGACVDAADTDGMTALHKAVQGGHVSVAAELLSRCENKAGALACRDARGRSPFDLCPQNDEKMKKLLCL